MIKVKIQTDNKRKFSIPVPYSFLRVFGSLLSSKFLWRQGNKWMNHQPEKITFSIVPLDPKMIKHFVSSIINELQHQKGLVIVDIKLQDGTQVTIKL
ncbi:hypothetical protein [Aneurinibacillus tyrosinisolvens]|uniref:hypothetical protein n=1 Tax=Aneurinibacillus tyrosinisolvens TaxID=1443435 RepID=UPI00063FBEDD|nr:hypothetical protein [Aneurinibacillus tyrosinisolvens]